jgi:hypothetical protein
MSEVSVDISSRQGAWHQSGLSSLLDDCARKWALSYELGLPSPATPATLSGRAYHAALESWLTARMAGGTEPELVDMARLAQAYVAEVFDEMLPHHRVGTSPDALTEEVNACLANWAVAPVAELGGLTLRQRLEHLELLAIEGHHRAALPGTEGCLPVGGTFDLLARDPDTGAVVLVDHKTVKDSSASVRRWRDPESTKGIEQAAMYAALCALDPDNDAVQWGAWPAMEFHIARKRASSHKSFRGALVVRRQPTDADIEDLAARVRTAQAQLEAGLFLPNPASNLCRANWCSHFERCQGTGELSGPWATVA